MQRAGYVAQWLPEHRSMRDGLVDLLGDLVRAGHLENAWIEGPDQEHRSGYRLREHVLCVRSEPAGEVLRVKPGEVLMVAVDPAGRAQFRLAYASGADPREFVHVPR